MAHRIESTVTALAFLFIGVSGASAQGLALAAKPAGKPAPATATAGASLRTPDGQPDLQGFWTNHTVTPLERPKELADKAFFTPEEAADFAKGQGTTVYTVAYGSESSGCTTDTTNMTPINQAGITPCQVMSEMASGSTYFYSDYNQSGSSSTCESPGTSVTSLNDIFTAIINDLLVVRLIPNGTT